jgi:hypothetical protein
MAISQSSGNEPWVFRVARAGDLIGVHRELIASAIPESEPIRSLLYSPRWEGRGRHFGIEARPASHGFAVTDRRFVISRETHDGSSPILTSIPFDAVLSVEKGSALLLAWLVIRYVTDALVQAYTILHKSTGAHHVDESLRAWRATGQAVAARPLQLDDHWKSVPRFLFHEMEPLLLDGESIRGSLHASERWKESRRFFVRRAVFVQPWTSLVIADRGLIFGVSEQPEEPGLYAFGANVVVVPAEVVAGVAVETDEGKGAAVNRLRIDLARNGASLSYEVAFDGPVTAGETVAQMVRMG